MVVVRRSRRARQTLAELKRWSRRECYAGSAEGGPVVQHQGISLADVAPHRHHGVQHVRDVERGEFQAGTLRVLLGFAVTVDLARTPDAAHLVGEHKR